ncbi:MAG: hypothetical protein KDC12_04225 [Flavobacteriales bacterium]|nr:hypothetical protein [Flavobacteriales bacterium]
MRKVLIWSMVFLAWVGCKRTDPVNPYDEVEVVQNDNPEADDLVPGSFAWLQASVFGPTCANSGCHDGTFEPNFSSMYSSYNTLVNHPVITNDEEGTFTYRVVPGNVDLSLLHERLTVFIDNTSGVMPLSLEPDSDWPENKPFYISQIENWIQAGAKDPYGNPPPNAGADFPPSAGGLVIFPAGNTTNPYPRGDDQPGINPIMVNATQIDLWVQVSDDNTDIDELQSTALRLSTTLTDFDSAPSYSLVYSSPVTALDFSNGEALFHYKATVDLSGAQSGDVYFIRTYWDDGAQPQLTEIPNAGSSDVMTALFILEVN